VKISVAAESANGGWLFSVKDNGIGIEMQYFEALKRLHGKEHPGSGVGLTICNEIVESAGGPHVGRIGTRTGHQLQILPAGPRG